MKSVFSSVPGAPMGCFCCEASLSAALKGVAAYTAMGAGCSAAAGAPGFADLIFWRSRLSGGPEADWLPAHITVVSRKRAKEPLRATAQSQNRHEIQSCFLSWYHFAGSDGGVDTVLGL